MSGQALITKAMAALIKRANAEHAAITDPDLRNREAVAAACEHAIKAGQALLKAQKKAGHGNWEGLFEDSNVFSEGGEKNTFAFTRNHASRYTKMANYPTLARQKCVEDSAFNLNAVYARLGSEKKTKTEMDALEREAREALKVKRLPAPPVVLEGQYSTIVIDPPWPVTKIVRDVRPHQGEALDYPVMSVADIGAMVLPAADDCHLYLWTTQRFLRDSFGIVEGWGFKPLVVMVWHKPGGFQPAGLPQYNCEFVLLARRGRLDFVSTKAFPTCFSAPRREHSRKPDEFYDIVRRVSPGPRIDIFSRELRDGFSQFGNQVDHFQANRK